MPETFSGFKMECLSFQELPESWANPDSKSLWIDTLHVVEPIDDILFFLDILSKL